MTVKWNPPGPFMREALRLAERGRGTTSPNPMVGAVVVRGGRVIGRGWHRAAGEPHAEAIALEDAGAKARGAALYVTLEPCCHTGRTGPCTERIIEAGIARVSAAVIDPFPEVRGRGIARLREAGIRVDVGEGDYLMAVNGVPVDTAKDPWASFLGLVDREVTLTLSPRPGTDSQRRDVVVTPRSPRWE